MMNKETLVKFLETYNYEFSENEQFISIELEFNQMIFVEFKPDKQIKITDKLIGWNFLTGVIEMHFKNALRYNLIGGALAAFIFLWFFNSEMNFIFLILLIFVFFWILLFSAFYHTQLENFKTRIMNLSD